MRDEERGICPRPPRDTKGETKAMNVLMIGNSFSMDATRYLTAIAAADGERLETFNLYIGGCSLELHHRNMLSGERAYSVHLNGGGGGVASLDEGLADREWDVVTLQQVSHLSFKPESYRPYIGELAAYVRRRAPKAKLYLHETWAYEEGSEGLLEVAKYPTSAAMLSDVVKTYAEMAGEIGACGILRSGELFGVLAERGIAPLHRDTRHASLGIGRLALGLLWYRTLTGRSVLHNGFCDFDEPIAEETAEEIRATVENFCNTRGDQL